MLKIMAAIYSIYTQNSPTQDTSLHGTATWFFWIKNFDTRCLYAQNPIQYKHWQINKFYSRISQQHNIYSIHIFIVIAAIIYF
jgi:hypothetical protein